MDAGVDGCSAAATPAEDSTRGGGAGICRTTGRTQLSNPYINVSRPPPNIADPSTWLTFTLPESKDNTGGGKDNTGGKGKGIRGGGGYQGQKGGQGGWHAMDNTGGKGEGIR